jgi:hypothetical protein
MSQNKGVDCGTRHAPILINRAAVETIKNVKFPEEQKWSNHPDTVVRKA